MKYKIYFNNVSLAHRGGAERLKDIIKKFLFDNPEEDWEPSEDELEIIDPCENHGMDVGIINFHEESCENVIISELCRLRTHDIKKIQAYNAREGRFETIHPNRY